MSFDLRITFSGLCLYAWEETGGVATGAHVLMPDTSDLGAPHTVRILYDVGQESGAGLTGSLAVVKPPPGSVLELGHGSTQGEPTLASPVWSKCVAQLERFDQTPLALPRTVLSKPAPGIAFRATLHSGAAAFEECGGPWTMRRKDGLYLAFRVTWSILNVQGSSLVWALTVDGQDETQKELVPYKNAIDLFVYHAPVSEIPPNTVLPHPPRAGEPASHFEMLYAPFGHVPNPVLPVAPPGIGLRGEVGASSPGMMTATTATCMGGQAIIAPT